MRPVSPAEGAAPAPQSVRPPVGVARPRPRHRLVLASFGVAVLLPVAVSAWYLWSRAADRYLSQVSFSVRTEETASALQLLGGVAQFSGSSSSDTDILYNFIQSQEMVRAVDARLDLRALWARADPASDPVFAYHPPGTIEDMVDYWQRMVAVYNDRGTGLVDIEVQAFTPQDAQAIAEAVFAESSGMINRLSALAREDSLRYAREELDAAVERLKVAREAVTRFRNRTQIVDPAASIQTQMGLLSSLQFQLAETLIDLDLLRQTAAASDPRVTQAERRIEVIEERIAEERRKLGLGSAAGPASEQGAFADVVGEYERLSVDLRFAEQAYTAALAAYDAAVAESRRQTRYIAAHVAPTLAEQAERPQRWQTLGLIALFTFLVWAIAVMGGYALKDRR